MRKLDKEDELRGWSWKAEGEPDCYYHPPHRDDTKKGKFVSVFLNGDYLIHYFVDKPLDRRHGETDYGYPIERRVEPEDIEWMDSKPLLLQETASIQTNGESRPVYAKRDGSNWIGMNKDFQTVTEPHNTLKGLRNTYNASESKGFDTEGGKVYQLIYPPQNV